MCFCPGGSFHGHNRKRPEGSQSSGHRPRGCSTGLSLETQRMREKRGPKKYYNSRLHEALSPQTELDSNSTARSCGYSAFFCFASGSYHGSDCFLGLLLWYFPWRNFTAQTVLLSISVSSAGLKPTKQFLSLVFPSCLAWKNSELVREKQTRLVLENKVGPQRELTNGLSRRISL